MRRGRWTYRLWHVPVVALGAALVALALAWVRPRAEVASLFEDGSVAVAVVRSGAVEPRAVTFDEAGRAVAFSWCADAVEARRVDDGSLVGWLRVGASYWRNSLAAGGSRLAVYTDACDPPLRVFDWRTGQLLSTLTQAVDTWCPSLFPCPSSPLPGWQGWQDAWPRTPPCHLSPDGRSLDYDAVVQADGRRWGTPVRVAADRPSLMGAPRLDSQDRGPDLPDVAPTESVLNSQRTPDGRFAAAVVQDRDKACVRVRVWDAVSRRELPSARPLPMPRRSCAVHLQASPGAVVLQWSGVDEPWEALCPPAEVARARQAPLLRWSVTSGRVAVVGRSLTEEFGEGQPPPLPASPPLYAPGKLVCELAQDGVVQVNGLLAISYLGPVDWVVWTRQGYYSATPQGEARLSWVGQGEGRTAIHRAAEFREWLCRPVALRYLLQTGSMAQALVLSRGR